MSITTECPRCGYVRTIERAAVIDGSWRAHPCPNCAQAGDDDDESQRSE